MGNISRIHPCHILIFPLSVEASVEESPQSPPQSPQSPQSPQPPSEGEAAQGALKRAAAGVSKAVRRPKKQHLVAVCLLVLVALWMTLPRGDEGSDEGYSDIMSSNRPIVAVGAGGAVGDHPEAVVVRAERVAPAAYIERVRVRGRTKASRHVEVKAEQPGRIVGDPVPRGARVAQGDLLCQLAVDSREAELAEARSRHEQAAIEYRGALDLQSSGLQSDAVVAQRKTALESAAAAVSRTELALRNTRIIAPFAGVVERRTVEQGDLLKVGDVCASVLDDSPMLLTGLVPEQDVDSISLGNKVQAMLVDGRPLTGVVTFVSRAADPVSRSYRIEAEVDAEHNTVREGITAEMLVATAEITAHLVPSSALSLDDSGIVGVKLIDDDGQVRFQPVQIIGDNTSQLDPGIWVSGMRGTVTLITVGQEIVFPGQKVQADFSWDDDGDNDDNDMEQLGKR